MKPSPARTVSKPRPWPAILIGLSFLAATGGYWRALIVHDQRQPPVVQTDQAPKTLAHQALGHPLANLALVAGSLLSFMLGFGFYTVQYGRRLNQQLREEIEDHEEAREKLRRSEARFRQVVEHISEVFWLATPDKKRFLYISPGYDTIWGRSRDRLYQRPLDWLDALHPEDQERIRVSLDTLAAGGYEREYRIIRPDGSLRWIRDRAFPVRNERGLVEAIAGTAEDITERKRAEQQLRDTEILYRLLLQSTDQGIFGLDAEGRCTFLNQAAQEMFGYPPQSVLGENMHRLIHHSYPDGSSYPQEACAIFSAFRTGRGCRRDTEVMWRSDGTAFPVEYSSYPLFDDGANKGAVIAFTDITIRKQAEEALRESETRFRTMADTAPVMIWMSGPDKLCTYFNQGWLGYTGRTMEQELGSGWAQGVHQEDLDRRLRTYEEAFARREPFRMEYRLRKVDGQYGWILDSGTPRQLPNGDFAGYIGSCIDITERTRAEASLDERVRLSSFTAEVSLTLNREMSIDEILRRCAEMAVHHLDLAFARIWTVEPGDLCESCFKAADCTDRTQCLHLRASAGLSTNLHGEYRRVPMGALKIGRIAQGTGLMSTNDVLGDERLPNKEWMQQNGLQSFAGLPLVIEGEVYGVLGVFARMPLPEATVRTLESVCNGIAATIARKRTASKLQLTQFTVDHAVDAIYWVDPRAKILEVNDAACTMVGYSKDELCAMTVHDLNPDFPEERWPALGADSKRRGTMTFESGHRAKNGRLIPVEITVNFLSYEGKEFHCAFVRNIAERKKTEDALKLFRALLDQATDAVEVIDPATGRFLDCNENAHSCLGYSREEFLSLTVPDIDPIVTAPIFQQYVTELQKGGGITLESTHRRNDGSTFPIEVKSHLARLDREYLLAIVRDITERKRAEEERTTLLHDLKTANDRLGRLSHQLMQVQETERRQLARDLHDEIGQALTAVTINLQTLSQQNEPAAQSSQLQDSVGIVENLVRHVRALCLDLRPSMLDDLGLVPALRWYLTRQAARAGWTLDFQVDDAIPALPESVQVAGYRIAQEAVTNVMRHAGTRRVWVRLACVQEILELSVKDDGIGFAVPPAGLSTGKNGGLGLLGMQERARFAGGEWTIESTPGHGTTVRTRLPFHGLSVTKTGQFSEALS